MIGNRDLTDQNPTMRGPGVDYPHYICSNACIYIYMYMFVCILCICFGICIYYVIYSFIPPQTKKQQQVKYQHFYLG